MNIDDTHRAAFIAGFAEGMRAARDGFLAALAETGHHVMRSSVAETMSDSRIADLARRAARRGPPAVPPAEDELEQRRRGA